MKEITPLGEREFEPRVEDIHIPSLHPAMDKFLVGVRPSITTKMVCLRGVDNNYFFEHAVFEGIHEADLKLTAMASRRALSRVADGTPPEYLTGIADVSESIPLTSPDNISVSMIRRAAIELTQSPSPEVRFLDLKDDLDLIHPGIKSLLRPYMHMAVGLPLYAGTIPLGVVWGLSSHPFKSGEKKEIERHLASFFTAVSTILAAELMSGDPDAGAVKRGIENADTASRYIRNLRTNVEGQNRPVRTIIAHSHQYGTDYRLDVSFIVPTSRGFAVSLKRFLPAKPRSTKNVLLMIPGFFNNRTLLDRLSREMALKYGYVVFSLDLRGRSRETMADTSMLDRGWTVDDYIWEDFPVAVNWISRQYPDAKIVVYGHSMGGMLPRFYTGAYETAKRVLDYEILPDPRSHLAGIVTMTSPTYINIRPSMPGFEAIKKGAQAVAGSSIAAKVINLFSSTVSAAVPTIGPREFFSFLHGTMDAMPDITYKVGTSVPTIRDFVGYKQITPPEWYFLLEDTFCTESIKSITQFVKSQLMQGGYYSFDGTINYTEEQKNMDLPLYTIIGTRDRIATPETVRSGDEMVPSQNKVVGEYPQGHLGILLHPGTVEKIAADTHAWLKKL